MGRICLHEISNWNSFCSRWSQLTSLVAFIAGKLTPIDTLNGGKHWEHFSSGKPRSADTIMQGRDAWEESWQWNSDIREATEAGQATSSNLVCPRFLHTRGNGLAFLRFAQLSLESLQTNINGTPLLATFSMKFK